MPKLSIEQSEHVNKIAKLISKRLGKAEVDVQAAVGIELIICEYMLKNNVRLTESAQCEKSI